MKLADKIEITACAVAFVGIAAGGVATIPETEIPE